MSEIIGRQIEIGVATESTRGTVQTIAEKWIKNVSANIREKAEHAIDDNSHASLEDSDNRRVVTKNIAGDIEGIMHADPLGFFFYNLYGSVVSSNVTGVVYSHVFNLDQTIKHPALTFFAKDGGIQQLAFNGCMVENLKINATVNDYVRFTASINGRAAIDNSDAPSYNTEYDWIGKDVSVKIADTEAGLVSANVLSAKDIEISWETGNIVDYVLNSYNPEDIYNSKMMIEGSMTLNFKDETQKDLYLGDDSKYLEITIEGTEDLGSGNYPKIVILLHKVKLMNWEPTGANDELVTEKVDFKAFYSNTDSKQSQITLQNVTPEYDVYSSQ